MLYALIERSDFAEFVSVLQSQHLVVGPRKKGDGFVFASVKDPSELALGYDTTILPPKKYFLPPGEALFRFDLSTRAVTTETREEEKRVLFGLHACDIRSLQLLDLVFDGAFKDSEYLRRRASTIIIGYNCEPHESCFCSALGTGEIKSGFDLFFTDRGEDYLVQIGTGRGDQLLRRFSRFREVGAEDLELFISRNDLKESVSCRKPGRPFSDFLYLADRQDVWRELGRKCFSCASCSAVCPTCYCFSVSDEVSLNLKEGVRERSWDSCLSRDFAAVTGHNFRQSAAARLRFRFYHKLSYCLEQYGSAFCVGCGRCVRSCLAGIHLPGLIEKVTGESLAEKESGGHALRKGRK
jgi:ferredoxin